METVNTQTTGNQLIATTVSLDGGGYVIAWRGVAYSGQAIWFQRYDADGAKVGAETWAKDVDPSGAESPLLVALEGGRFLVNGKQYDAAGIPMGGGGNATLGLRYSLTPEGDHLSESDPTIAGLPGGGYVTIETKTALVHNTYPGETFVLRWFNEAGEPQRQYERPLETADGGTTAAKSLSDPGVLALADGKVLATWHVSGRRTDLAEFDLYAADGRLLRHEDITVRGAVSQLEASPLPDGGYIVAWAGSDYMTSAADAFYQRYDAGGARVGEAVSLGPVTLSSDPVRVSTATTLTNGDVLLVFETRRPDGTTDIAVEHLDDVAAGGGPPPPPPPASEDGQVITSPAPGSTLTGGAGNDTLIASQGPDVLSGGGGGDVFLYRDLPWNAGRITDFALGSDKLDLSAIFRSSGYAGSDPVADGRMRFDSDGAGGTRVYFDQDAPNAGDWPFLVTTFSGISPGGLTWRQLSGDGGEVINSPGPGSAVQGGAGNDTINASQGPDQLTGGAGADYFTWAALPWNAGHVTDFAPGTDRLDLRALFQASDYAGADPVADRRLEFRPDGTGDTQVYFDRDAPDAGDWPFLITTLDGVSPSQITTTEWLFR